MSPVPARPAVTPWRTVACSPLAAATMCALMSGCATGDWPVAGAGSASLRVRQLGFAQSFGELRQVSPDGSCGPVRPLPNLSGPASGQGGGNSVELKLAPGRYNLATESQELTTLTPVFCSIGLSVTLPPAGRYELVLGSDTGVCQGQLSRLTPDQPPRRVPVAPDPLVPCR